MESREDTGTTMECGYLIMLRMVVSTCGHPPPIVADVALEECLKAVHKRTDAYQVFVIPKLYFPAWRSVLQVV